MRGDVLIYRVWGGRIAWFGALFALLVAFLFGLFVQAAYAGLAGGRAYEQVSPSFKAGYPVFGKGYGASAEDGEAVEFASVGAFSGSGESPSVSRYVAKRGPGGWNTFSLLPSIAGGVCWQGLEEMTPELTKFEHVKTPGVNSTDCEYSPFNTLWVLEPGGSLLQASPVMTTETGVENSMDAVAASDDLLRFVIAHGDDPAKHLLYGEEHIPVSGDETQAETELFEVDSSSVHMVALNNGGGPLTRFCNVSLGGSSLNGKFGAVSQPDASEVFFSVPVQTQSGGDNETLCNSKPGHPLELFVRLGGEKTLEISKPMNEECGEGAVPEVPCKKATSRQPAFFQGASADGSKVFFTSQESGLVPGNTDSSNNLYMARIGCPGSEEGCEPAAKEVKSLTQVSRDPNAGESSEVQSRVLAISPDGTHVYLIARGSLSSLPNSQGETATSGAENLYLYDDAGTSESVSFVARLCSGAEVSGNVSDSNCPSSLNSGTNDSPLWSEGTEYREAETTGSGKFLVFSTYARLIGNGAEADTDSARDVYRYDAETGVLDRVSLGEAGADGNGNGEGYNAEITGTRYLGAVQEQAELDTRAMTEDGSTVVFTSSEPLSADAVNGQQDVYVWHEGAVSMISSGTASEPDEEPVITPSGRDIFFTTSAGLVSDDTDGLRDVYDARVGGGFPSPAAAVQQCSGEACLGPLSVPAPVLVPGSVSQQAGGNLSQPVAKTKPKPTKKKKKTKKKKAASRPKKPKQAKSGRQAKPRRSVVGGAR